ncbi:tRNA glutamyl-Q(34) synthetase GluQRS [Endozoicomonas sp. SM1973]|uniref:Glutamyl-Q tRNA(Asp) synthetase n=1 Tax=Spartinivicinus marinus TaxID=2994442 RepID=A0A853I6N0_9GAMM|nr:tRNA glutamyl-Q(34) synthetase GluQRS [Spartinivicinus marinus]MCX4026342.1 tRNA glutamyl-Q(34) synthetase GluQRS [Spartinivicinus marinus]NYZ67312.1 tRNA glutamyl-Q(34) synthetase GluQRS [Spartinivicinus marinus]
MTAPQYIGRFAPSPTGPLHFGSLVSAVASYLDAKANQGQWQVRIEDTDPPREQPGAASLILKALEIYGLYWDGPVVYQSKRSELYRAALTNLQTEGFSFFCTCSRRQLTGQSVYPGYCHDKALEPDDDHSIKVKTANHKVIFDDLVQGIQQCQFGVDDGDFVVFRKDGLFAYQLAVTVDDQEQGITHIVRGSDLLTSTPKQCLLQQYLGYQTPFYAHHPVINKEDGSKLSKQTFANPLPLDMPAPQLLRALIALGHTPPKALANSSVNEIIEWGVQHWQLPKVPKAIGIPEAALQETFGQS